VPDSSAPSRGKPVTAGVGRHSRQWSLEREVQGEASKQLHRGCGEQIGPAAYKNIRS
jgi:hypothetical protein